MKGATFDRPRWRWETGENVPRIVDFTSAIAGLAGLLLCALAPHWVAMARMQNSDTHNSNARDSGNTKAASGTETLVAGYVGNPIYYRSNISVVRPDGTDLKLHGLGWDGDALHFPIDGGVRYVRWNGRFGFMIDSLHNKAIARLGKSSHGRKLKYPVVEEVPASGTFRGKPVSKRVKLNEIFERLEFTHGHNLLYFTGMFRLPDLSPGLRPYVGLGGGFAIPHTEVWFKGEGKAGGTYEYQYAGPAVQGLLGIELQVGRVSYFVEYKFSYAWINGLLTAGKSWKNWNLPGDLLRQFSQWIRGAEPKNGRFSTALGAHQIVVGAGYRSSGKSVR
jgi:lipid A oxidase